jgi:hypothetical protein
MAHDPLCDDPASKPRPKQKRTFEPGLFYRLQGNHSRFIQYDWQSKLQTLNDYMAEMAMLG